MDKHPGGLHPDNVKVQHFTYLLEPCYSWGGGVGEGGMCTSCDAATRQQMRVSQVCHTAKCVRDIIHDTLRLGCTHNTHPVCSWPRSRGQQPITVLGSISQKWHMSVHRTNRTMSFNLSTEVDGLWWTWTCQHCSQLPGNSSWKVTLHSVCGEFPYDYEGKCVCGHYI